jgi:hypothetical protein
VKRDHKVAVMVSHFLKNLSFLILATESDPWK